MKIQYFTKIQRFPLLAMAMAATLVIAGCDTGKSEDAGKEAGNATNSAAPPDWLSEEVLVQLQDINAELKSLRAEVKALNERLDSAPPVAQAAGAEPPNATIDLASAQRLGDEGAEVAVLEFTDFQCPYCGRHHRQAFTQIKRNYVDTGKVQYLSMDYPLSFHDNAHSAAVAARCAGQQGKYWEMHDALFDNQNKLGNAFYSVTADTLGLNVGTFSNCLENPSVSKQVDQDMIAGSRYGVRGTPAFFLGRIKDGKLTDVVPMRGAQSYESFSRVIEALLN